VLTVKLALVAPAGTITLEGTLAAAVFVAGQCDLHATCGSRPAQRHRARGGLCAASDSRGIQSQ